MSEDTPPTIDDAFLMISIGTCRREAAGDVAGLLPEGKAVEIRSSVANAARPLDGHAVGTANETATARETVSRIDDAVELHGAEAAHATA